jgi:hypothetical protein
MAQQGGMFGPTPEELQYAMSQQQQDEDFRDAGAWGNKSLGQQISTGAYAGGMGIGRGLQSLGQATGYLPQDPRIAEAQRLMEVKKGLMEANLDPQDIDAYYPEMIKRLNAAGFPDQASQAMKQYTSAQSAQGNLQARLAEIEVKKAAALKARREMQYPGYAVLGRLTKAVMDNPRNGPVLAKFEQSITEQNKSGDMSILADLEEPMDKDSDKPQFYTADNKAVYRDRKGQYVLESTIDPETKGAAQVKKYGSYAARPPTPVVSIDDRRESEAQKAETAFRASATAPVAKAFHENNQKAAMSSARIDNLVDTINNNPMFSGSGADLQVGIANFMKTIGIEALDKKLTSSQIVDALVGPEILAAMKQLGGQDSNEELRKITSMQPNRVMTKEAMLHTATVLQAENMRSKLKAQNYNDYLAAGGKALDFRYDRGFMEGQQDPAKAYPVPVFDPNTLKTYPNKNAMMDARKQKSLSTMTDAELREAAAKARSNQ